MTTSASSFSKDSLNEYLNALRDYKKTGYKQTRSIIATLKKTDLTPMQILEMQPGPWMRFIEKIRPENDEEREFKESIHELMEGLYQRFKDYKGDSLSKMSSNSQARAEQREDKENANINIRDQPEGRGNKKGGLEALPKAVVDFTVKTLAEGLMTDCQDAPGAKKVVQQLATEKATELENVIREETKNDPEAYRMEARNVSNFLMTKNNENLREGLLQGEISCEEFVNNKEDFLPNRAKEVIEENEKRHYEDVNADYDRKMVPKSKLHTCEKCGSSRVTFTEKLMGAADQESTSVLVCADCDHVELKHDRENA